MANRYATVLNVASCLQAQTKERPPSPLNFAPNTQKQRKPAQSNNYSSSDAIMSLRPRDPHLELTDGTVLLRAGTPEDAPLVTRLVLASLSHLQPWLPWATSSYTEDSALEYFSGHVDPTAHPFLVFNMEGQLVGGTGLNRIDLLNLTADIGYWIGAGHMGKGYATRATNLMAKHAVETVGLERVEIICSVENEASRKVAERSIATYEGIQKSRLRVDGRQHDAHCYVVVNDVPE